MSGLEGHKMDEKQEQIAAYRLLVSEISAEIRSRRDPEHIFTAAVVGALGAVAWGVAATASLSSVCHLPTLQHPAVVGIATILLMAGPVLSRIIRENGLYRALRREQVRINTHYIKLVGLSETDLPPGLRSNGETNGKGYWFSSAIVILSTIGTLLFCLSIYWVTRVPTCSLPA